MFAHETAEKQTGIVSIPDCEPESFELFLKYIYTGKLEELSFEKAFHLYQTSEKHDVQELKAFCCKFLCDNLTAENFFGVLIIADKYSNPELRFAAQRFFRKNSSGIVSTSEWKLLSKFNGRLSNQLISYVS